MSHLHRLRRLEGSPEHLRRSLRGHVGRARCPWDGGCGVGRGSEYGFVRLTWFLASSLHLVYRHVMDAKKKRRVPEIESGTSCIFDMSHMTQNRNHTSRPYPRKLDPLTKKRKKKLSCIYSIAKNPTALNGLRAYLCGLLLPPPSATTLTNFIASLHHRPHPNHVSPANGRSLQSKDEPQVHAHRKATESVSHQQRYPQTTRDKSLRRRGQDVDRNTKTRSSHLRT